MSADTLFWDIAEGLMAVDPRVQEGTIMKGRCLRANEEFVGLAGYKDGGLVVKLNGGRVAELIHERTGQPFGPAGRVFKEWVMVPELDRELWTMLLRESIDRALAAT